MWPWWVMIPIEDLTDVTLKKVEIAKEVIRSDCWWRFACGDVLFKFHQKIKWISMPLVLVNLFCFDKKAKSTGPHHKVFCLNAPNYQKVFCLEASAYLLICYQDSCLFPPLPPAQPLFYLGLCRLVLLSSIVGVKQGWYSSNPLHCSHHTWSPASSPPPPPPATADVAKVGSKWRCYSCFNPDTYMSSTTCQHVRHLQQGGGLAASWEYLSWVGHCHSLSVVFFNALVCDQYHTKYKYTKKILQ